MAPNILIINTISAPPVLKSILHQAKFAVDSVCTIRDGLNLQRARNYDTIILLEHPDADSPADCAIIRRASASPLIVISSNASATTCLSAIQEGADFFLRKPFGPMELIARIKALLNRAPARQTAVGSPA